MLGLRIALGASPADIRRHVVWQGFSLTLLGITLGVLLALASSRILSVLLFQVSPTDPWTFGMIGSLMILAALLASYLPSRQATQIEPQRVL